MNLVPKRSETHTYTPTFENWDTLKDHGRVVHFNHMSTSDGLKFDAVVQGPGSKIWAANNMGTAYTRHNGRLVKSKPFSLRRLLTTNDVFVFKSTSPLALNEDEEDLVVLLESVHKYLEPISVKL